MCGIFGYVGSKPVVPILIDGLKRLEYRGYDSAGIAISDSKGLLIKRSVGQISDLENKISDLEPESLKSTIGIAHTRWATHGGVTVQNAHPHNSGNLAICHNGIIDNYDRLRQELTNRGFKFKSETDSEVIAHLISLYYRDAGKSGEYADPKEAVEKAISRLRGTYGIVVIFYNHDLLIAARQGSPLVIGVGDQENFVASDTNALVKHTDRVIYMEDGEIAVITSDKIDTSVQHSIMTIEEIAKDVDKNGYEHYMLKEIFEQPDSIQRCLAGRVRENTAWLSGFNLDWEDLSEVTSVTILACGTSYYAGMVAANWIEEFVRIPCHVKLASEAVSGRMIVDKEGLYLAVSQSGETFDTIECIKELKTQGCRVYGIVNVVGSTIPRMCDGGAYIHAGPEIAVASTKAFTGQLAALNMFTCMLGRAKNMTKDEGQAYCLRLKYLPYGIKEFLDKHLHEIKTIAEELVAAKYVLFLGRGVSYPIALEGALKFKEICYSACDAYAGGEMKHGPIAMIQKGTPVICVAPADRTYDKMIATMNEVKARGAKIISIGPLPNADLNVTWGDYSTIGSPFISVITLQLIAYYVALLRGNEIDKPRNLAKSVTVG